MDFKQFMNIIILGAGGFIGKNLALALVKNKDVNLTLVDKSLSYFSDIRDQLPKNVRYVSSSLDDNDRFPYLENQDLLFHLASSNIPTSSNLHVSLDMKSNVVFSSKLFDSCVVNKIKKVIFISSGGTVYGKESKCPLSENLPTDPISSYGLQKLTIEKLLYLYDYMFGLDYRVVRLANPYGPYQRPNGKLGVVTTFINKAINNEELCVYGDGSVVRDFIYIDDAIRAIVNIAFGEFDGNKVYNLGCGYGTSVKSIIEKISSSLNLKLNISYKQSRSVDVPVNFLDISRYESSYGKLSPLSLEDGIVKTANFLKSIQKKPERIGVIMGKMHSGGKKNLVMEYYRNIDRSKYQFDFICDDDSNSIPKDEIELLGGRVYIVPRYQNIIKNILAIKKICKDNRYKIVHGYNGTMNIFGLFAAYMSGVPVRINESISMAHRSDNKTILKNILKPFSRFFSTNFVANGEECGKWQFMKFYEQGKVSIFKTVIDVNKNKYSPELREKCRNEFHLEDSFVVGHIGRLTAQKNTLFIIDIFNEILKLKKNAKLLIIGDGDLREPMLSKVSELGIESSVLYLGRREDIRQFYNAMDCFLLPSLYEGLPVVGVEAQCCGLPVYFSNEIPKESSASDKLGHFLSLEDSAKYWAEKIVDNSNNYVRKDFSFLVRSKGFDSELESMNLALYYDRCIKNCLELKINNS